MFVCHVGNPELTHLAKLSAVCWPADTCQWYHKVQDYPSRQYELCCQSIRQGIKNTIILVLPKTGVISSFLVTEQK